MYHQSWTKNTFTSSEVQNGYYGPSYISHSKRWHFFHGKWNFIHDVRWKQFHPRTTIYSHSGALTFQGNFSAGCHTIFTNTSFSVWTQQPILLPLKIGKSDSTTNFSIFLCIYWPLKQGKCHFTINGGMLKNTFWSPEVGIIIEWPQNVVGRPPPHSKYFLNKKWLEIETGYVYFG